ncbi:MAG: pyrrolo-quinoline quinone [Opitutus sp.]|nr:pyrrolo-quinoline quinone [Opitutus sp.]
MTAPHCSRRSYPLLAILAARLLSPTALPGADQPQWGQRWSRNLVSEERGLPDSFNPKTSRNIRWVAKLGTETHSTPIVSGGRVYIGTNNGDPRDPKHQGDRGVLMCFDEQDGQLLWQLVVPKREEDPYHDWPKSGISSPVTVEGDRVYLVNNRGEVMCLDAHGLANGNDGPFREEGAHLTPRGADAPAQSLEPGPLDADILWVFDLTKEAGIWSHDSAHSSILIHGNQLYLNTGTGVDNTHRKIRTPDAPSLVVLDKRTGRLIARDEEHIAPNIFHCTWSSPSLADVNGRPLLFFAGGNGVVYAFEPAAQPPVEPAALAANHVAQLKKIWQFDFDPAGPKAEVHRFTTNRIEGPSNIYGMPMFHDGRLYVAGGGDLFWGKNEAWLKCIDPAKSGDITAPGLIWSYALEKHVFGTPVLHAGLIYLADCGRKFHCVEAATGRPVWTHEVNGEVWASPLVADGKIYLGTRSGAFYVFATGREKRLLSESQLGRPISATVTAANGTLYVATMTHLYAVRKDAN